MYLITDKLNYKRSCVLSFLFDIIEPEDRSGLRISGVFLVTFVLVDGKSLPCRTTSSWALEQLKANTV